VFTPDNVGFVHLEFQISHHVSEGTFVVSTCFPGPPQRVATTRGERQQGAQA
jgi:hypothetical protein